MDTCRATTAVSMRYFGLTSDEIKALRKADIPSVCRHVTSRVTFDRLRSASIAPTRQRLTEALLQIDITYSVRFT